MFLLRQLESLDWIMFVGWGLVFVVTLIIELETSDLTTVWFCISSVITLICGILFAPPLWQLIIFVGLSILLILLTRPLTKKMMRKEIIKTNADRVIGMIAVVTKDITPGEIGEVKVENRLWRAINNEGLSLVVGEKVSVDSIVGIKLVVSKLSGTSNIEIV